MNKMYFFLFILFLGCKEDRAWIKNQNTGNALGTTYSIIYLAEDKLDFQQGIDSIFKVVNQSMSTYIPNSDISKINSGDTTIIVDHMFKEVFELSREVYKTTQGYFDPTVGPLVNAWGFGPGEQIALDSTKVDSLLQFVGFNMVELTANDKIRKRFPEVFFDFNAIAKGYTIDRLGAMLNEKGIENYLVEVGGEVLTKGKNQFTKKQWTVGIDDPQVEIGRQLKKIVNLEDKAMASSGNYRKFRVDAETGEKYVHTIDPKTGYTKNAKVLAASVVANSCAKADAYATAFMAMDLEDAKRVLGNEDGLEAYIIFLDEENIAQDFMTEGFHKFIKP